MSSFDKLFVNSTNRLSAVRNIIISQASGNKIQSNQNFFNCQQQSKKQFKKSCNKQQITQTFQELQQRYNQLKKTVNEGKKQKQLMQILFTKIFNIQQGDQQKLKQRYRRKKNQIESKHQCFIPDCQKIYSSSTSLARHMKLKHSQTIFQPPQAKYQIPPEPNLNDSTQLEKRQETLSHAKSEWQDSQGLKMFEIDKSEDKQESDYRQIELEDQEPS